MLNKGKTEGENVSITYITGNVLQPNEVSGSKVLVHVCNDVGAWGAGFVVALSKFSKEPEKFYKAAFRHDGPNKLGDCHTILINSEFRVVNMIAQEGLGEYGKPPIRYDFLEECLRQVNDLASALSASVIMPRIGVGLAGGKWECIEEIIERTLSVPVYVYTLPHEVGKFPSKVS